MAEERLIIEPEVEEILACIERKQNFLLSGGAGSGKTYSLVQVIRKVILDNPSCKVACMTYTNAAVKEIEERVNHRNLNVSTIHDFLWDNIKHFQKELKEALVTLANDEEETKIKIAEASFVPDDYFDRCVDGIQYKEFLKMSDGIISHDEVLIVANYIFEKYPKLVDIVKDKYQFIFIDEYQDTSPLVIQILLEHFRTGSKQNIIGFFGDAMQCIYDSDGVGDLNTYIDAGAIIEVQKKQNRRNPKRIIDLANAIRTDGLIQEPSTDTTAPNMVNGVVKEGDVIFLHSDNADINSIKDYLEISHNWDFNNSDETKELNLTHNLIADNAGFRELMDIYDKDQILAYRDRIKKYIKGNYEDRDAFNEMTFGEVISSLEEGKEGKELRAVKPTNGMQNYIDAHPQQYAIATALNFGLFSRMYIDKDQLIDDKKQTEAEESTKGSKRDSLIRHLFKIQNNISLYTDKRFNEFVRVTDYLERLTSIQAKRNLKTNIEQLIEVGDKTIEQVIQEAHEYGICIIDDSLIRFQEEKSYVYERVKQVQFRVLQKLYAYVEGKTPFSTQHKTKGTEFNDVLVVLDNGGWSKYNFQNLFLKEGTESVTKRTEKVFYVCCTRAKERLAIFYNNPSVAVLDKCKQLFGEEYMFSI